MDDILTVGHVVSRTHSATWRGAGSGFPTLAAGHESADVPTRVCLLDVFRGGDVSEEGLGDVDDCATRPGMRQPAEEAGHELPMVGVGSDAKGEHVIRLASKRKLYVTVPTDLRHAEDFYLPASSQDGQLACVEHVEGFLWRVGFLPVLGFDLCRNSGDVPGDDAGTHDNVHGHAADICKLAARSADGLPTRHALPVHYSFVKERHAPKAAGVRSTLPASLPDVGSIE